jgi:hypothetical protein
LSLPKICKQNLICELYEISYKPVCRKFLSIVIWHHPFTIPSKWMTPIVIVNHPFTIYYFLLIKKNHPFTIPELNNSSFLSSKAPLAC